MVIHIKNIVRDMDDTKFAWTATATIYVNKMSTKIK